jgi:hypothetical protein
MIGERIKSVKARLEKVKRQRGTQRKARERRGTFRVSLVGYTNAGKSTLFNALVKARAYAADQLFATLDTTTRALWLGEQAGAVSLSDTVGFIRDLPHKLVEAFEATLQEAAEADLLLHVVDASSPNLLEQCAEVERVLERDRRRPGAAGAGVQQVRPARAVAPAAPAADWIERATACARPGVRQRTQWRRPGGAARSARRCGLGAHLNAGPGIAPAPPDPRPLSSNAGLSRPPQPFRHALRPVPTDDRCAKLRDPPLPHRRCCAACCAAAARAAAWHRHERHPGLNGGRNDGPPDLDELWRDFNRKLSGLFGGKAGGRRPQRGDGRRLTAVRLPARHEERRHRRRPDRRRGVLVWLGSGFFIVQEGQQAVVTSFGKYATPSMPASSGASRTRSRRTRRCR